MGDKKKRFVSINFTGRELLNDSVFETTLEKTAKEAGIFDDHKKYSPMDIILGEREFPPKIEDILHEMNEGESRSARLLAKEAFGERSNNLIRVVPLQNFHDQKINPFPGLVVKVANAVGKVQSVGSGRVRVDFNHPLAGRDLEYHLELIREIKDKKEVAEKLYEKYYSMIPGSKKEIEGGKLTVSLSGDYLKNLDKVNESIKRIAKDFGVEFEVKGLVEGKSEKELPSTEKTSSKEDKETPSQAKKESVPEKEPAQPKPKNIHQLADSLAKPKKGMEFETKKDSASTIQRPKKKV